MTQWHIFLCFTLCLRWFVSSYCSAYWVTLPASSIFNKYSIILFTSVSISSSCTKLVFHVSLKPRFCVDMKDILSQCRDKWHVICSCSFLSLALVSHRSWMIGIQSLLGSSHQYRPDMSAAELWACFLLSLKRARVERIYPLDPLFTFSICFSVKIRASALNPSVITWVKYCERSWEV